MSYFGKNIRKIRSLKSLSQQAFAELFDLKRGTLGAYEEGRSEPKLETLIKIANYFSIPIDDLLTSELTVNNLLKFKGNLTIEQNIGEQEYFTKVPCITTLNLNDYVKYADKESFVQELPYLTLPINLDKKFRAFTVQNLEMSKNDLGMFPKDIVIGELTPLEVHSKLNNGTLVFIVTQDDIILRRLFISSGSIVLRADHKNVEDIVLTLKDIKEIWRVRYVFYHRIPETNFSLEEKLEQLEKDFDILKNNK
ncbi:DNA-binding transcriptional regulator, XRE-family HTH domain [Maribacter sedimenticola]|uniref:DNA-binding transcriptional regulator, XRE-family HTH domain n=1 Tax=Maribacter sedimenticola TaxID=228956 RepID=A0ABY1SHL0_9FLAO|nr:helix-turn-helix transcriptional regulator [Maribacter sedimenticola]SNR46564.1 DNA-binding transcriptional regulator, XRE-family HTH domain [Maribacter sedimenticola]